MHAVCGERVVFVNHHLSVRELVPDDHVVRIFGAVAVKDHRAAAGRDLVGQQAVSESPSGHVDVVDAVVTDLAVRVVFETPPRDMEAMTVEGP